MIQVNYRDVRPIYEQIIEGIQKLIITDALLPDEKLPSVRELASKLAINPNTISRAYRELEREGYVYSVCGRGTFVADNRTLKTEHVRALLQDFDETAAELLDLSVEKEALQKRIDRIGKGVWNDTGK